MTDDVMLHIIDDDQTFMKVHQELLDNLGFPVKYFDSPLTYLEEFDPDTPACLLTDILMPGMTGFTLLKELRKRNYYVPTIFMTAKADVNSVVYALRLGALNFIEKPLNEHKLLEALHEGLHTARKNKALMLKKIEFNKLYESLTARERQVCDLLLQGYLTKVIASELDISCSTAEIHRLNVLKKMGTRNVIALVHYKKEVDQPYYTRYSEDELV